MTLPGFGQIGEALRRATVQVASDGRGGGSGVIWDAAGSIVTNAHVAQTPAPLVQLWDGRTVRARVSRRDPSRDLALLEVHAADLAAATPGDSSAVRPGEMVIAVGHPFGFVGALSTGVVHALGPLRGMGPRAWIQADVRLAPGNSGGPLANAAGQVIGINTAIAGGLALAIPGNTVAAFVSRDDTARLGVTLEPVAVAAHGRQSLGLAILEIAPGGAAEDASLLPGDILVGVDGQPFRSIDDLETALAHRAGSVLRLEFLRGGNAREREVPVRLERRLGQAA